jgi:hypothetical protein
MLPVILATCTALPDGDEDAGLLVSALERAGVAATWQAWTDTAVEWASAFTVVRSTWDYTHAPEQFLAWTRTVPRLGNPAPVIEWSSDKVYLADLAADGVPIVPTVFARPGRLPALPADVEYVVKPSVGAGSRGAGRFAAGDVAGGRAHLEMLHGAGRTGLVQPYLSDVDTAGETALLYFGGDFSHAITKGAMLPEETVHPHAGHQLYVEERITPHVATDAELAVGAKVVAVLRARFGQDLLYARVDLLPGPEGPALVELELAEPSVFLGHDDGAADRFAACIAAAAA